MASPNVGKVTVGVEFDTRGIQKQLTRDVFNAIEPYLNKYNVRARELQSNIDKINQMSLDAIAKRFKMEREETAALMKAKNRYYEAEKKAAEAEELRDELKDKRTKARSAATRAENNAKKKGIKLDEKYAKARDTAEQAYEKSVAAVEKAIRSKEEALKTYQETDQRAADAFARNVQSKRRAVVDELQDTLGETRRSITDLIDEQRRLADEHYDTTRKMIRDEDRLQRSRRQARRDAMNLPGETLGQVIKSLSGLSLGVSTPALLTIGAGALVLAGALGEASKAMLAMPAAAGAFGVAMGTLQMATMGFGDTIGALIDGDLDKFDELINKLAPNAQQAALAIQALGPQFSNLQSTVQNTFFGNTPQMIEQLTEAFMPMVEQVTYGIADSVNTMMSIAARELLTPDVMRDLESAGRNVVAMFRDFEPVIAPLVRAISDLMAAGSELLPQFSNNIVELVKSFADFVAKNKENGKLVEWMREGTFMLGQLVELGWAFGEAMVALGPVARLILPVVIDLLEAIANLLTDFGPLILGVVTAFGAWKVIAGIAGLTSQLGKVSSLAGDGVSNAAKKGAGGIGGAFLPLISPGGVLSRVLITVMAIMDGMDRMNGMTTPGQSLLGIGEWAVAGGALAGMFGPVAGAVGFGVGGVAGAVNTVVQGNKAEDAGRQALEERAEQSRRDYPGVPATGDNLADILLGGEQPTAPTRPVPDARDVGDLLAGLGGGTPLPVEVTNDVPAPAPPAIPDDMAILVPGLDPSTYVPPAPGAAPDTTDLGWGDTPSRQVPDNPLDERGNKIPEPSNKDILDEIRAGIPLEDYAVDPYASVGGVANQPGWPGRPDLSVTVSNMPENLGAPMLGYPAAGMPLAAEAGYMPAAVANGALWDAIAKHESNNDWDNNNTGGHMTSSGAPRGGLQITDGTWAAFGGKEFAPTANLATREQQIAVAERIAWDGYNGTRPQGLGAWEVVTQGKVPGVTANTPRPSGAAAVMPTRGLPMSSYGVPDAYGAKPALDLIAAFAKANFGLNVMSGIAGPGSPTNRAFDGGFHDSGNAVDLSNGTAPTPQMRAFSEWAARNLGPYLAELIYNDDMGGVGIDEGRLVDANSTFGAADHRNHVHIAVRDEAQAAVAQILQGAAVPRSLKDGLFTANSPMTVDPFTGDMGYYQIDQQAVARADKKVRDLADELSKASRELQVLQIAVERGAATEQDVADQREKIIDLQERHQFALEDLVEAQTGKFKEFSSSRGRQQSMQQMLDDLPFGHPAKILGAAISGAGGSSADVGALVPMAFGDVLGAGLPGPLGYASTPTAPTTAVGDLVAERNPMAAFAAAGLEIPDYTRQGGGISAQDTQSSDAPPVDALGRVYSDTASLIDRTFTNLDAAEKARHDQVMAVLNQVAERVGAEVLEPVVSGAITDGLNGAANELGAAIGGPMGQTAGPAIAAAVESAMPQGGGSSGGAGGQLVNNAAAAAVAITAPGKATGGPVIGPGTGTSDSILARLSNGEWVLTAAQVRALGGFPGVQAMLDGLPGFATGGGVDVSSTVGAEFFGVSQVPLVGAIINLLISVLLKVIGVQIEARDTLDEISGDFRQFRGEFQAFDAAGRMMNDTSALTDRSGTSVETAADERIRILKLVLDALVKYIIEKVIVPVSKAIANSVIQAGAGAAGGAIGASFPGGSIVGGIVEGAIASAGTASVEIIADVGSEIGKAAISVAFDAAGEALSSYFPDLTSGLFGGVAFANLFDPLTLMLDNIIGTFTVLLGGLFGGLSTVIPGVPFDSGGVASGTGLMPKATLKPERVLSPAQTAAFDRLVDALSSGKTATTSTTIHAPFTVTGGEQGARQAHDRLLALMS